MFLDFYASYVALQLGIANNWYKIPTDQIGITVAVYLLCWLVATVMLTLATLRLPVAFTLLLTWCSPFCPLRSTSHRPCRSW